MRSLRPGHDGFHSLFDWLRQHFRQKTALNAPRVRRRLHRDDPSMARGLDLPAPSDVGDFYFEGHHLVLAAEQRCTNLSAAGAGGSCWHYNAGGSFEDMHPRWQCLCGLRLPSRPHITWCCPHTRHLREHISLPMDRAAERLLAKACPEQPPAPPAIDPDDLFDSLVDALSCIMRDRAVVYLATDGSEDQTVGAYAVALAPGNFSCSTGNGDEDQTPFKQEMLAFQLAAQALAKAAALNAWQAIFVMDCKAAMSTTTSAPTRVKYPGIAAAIRAALDSVATMQVQCQFVWVPSHGKHANWEAPPGMSSDGLRMLNDRADKEASACRLRRLTNSRRQAWWETRQTCARWEFEALMASSAASDMLHEHLRKLGNRPRECPAPP